MTLNKLLPGALGCHPHPAHLTKWLGLPSNREPFRIYQGVEARASPAGPYIESIWKIWRGVSSSAEWKGKKRGAEWIAHNVTHLQRPDLWNDNYGTKIDGLQIRHKIMFVMPWKIKDKCVKRIITWTPSDGALRPAHSCFLTFSLKISRWEKGFKTWKGI